MTTLQLNGGEDEVYIASEANVDFTNNDSITKLSGDLDAVLGGVFVDAGTGSQVLMISDEFSTEGKTVTMTEDSADGLVEGADISITGMTANGAISLKSFNDGVNSPSESGLLDEINIWASSGDDTFTITATEANDAVVKAIYLNTGLGDDTVTATLTKDNQDVLVVELELELFVGNLRVDNGQGIDPDSPPSELVPKFN